MDDKKFCFISCVNNKQYYNECLYYISKLNIPEGYKIEMLSIEDATSMTAGYNKAMKMTDAKYKIYLHQDTFILDEDILYVILDIFKDTNVGMIGAVGSKTISAEGYWWNTENIYGNYYDNVQLEMKKTKSLEESKEEYIELKAIDGFIMITQYDVPWREDIFDNWHYYDYSESIEFLKAGYKVVTPNIDKTWVMHDCGLVNSDLMDDYYKYNKVFVEEYGDYLFPLVSILIPSYNRPELFKIALESAINQTYENIEIIICDDSTNNKIEELMKDYLNKYDNIRYYHNEKNLGQFDNDLKLMKLAKGKYINFLMDDDVFELDKIRKMMDVFLNDVDGDIGIVTSNRKVIDRFGNYKGNFISNDVVNKFANKKVDGKELMEFIMLHFYNIIGEPTTALFNKEKMTEQFGYFNNRRYICNVDEATWMNILINSSIVILDECLSSFRILDNQQSNKKEMIIGGAKDYKCMLLDSKKVGLFTNNMKYYRALINCIKYVDGIINKGDYDSELLKMQEELYEKINVIKKELPLVSILIPTYNRPEYLDIALDSAVNQTYPNIEIIIGDNSDNRITEEMLKKKYLCKYEKIKYINNNGNIGGLENINKLFNNINGEYCNLLMDDDVFSYDKIEKMMSVFFEDSSVSIVTSYRKLIDNHGRFLKDRTFNKKIYNDDVVIRGTEVGNLLLTNMTNFIGEPSAVLIKNKYLKDENGAIRYGFYNGKQYSPNADVAMWLECCKYGNVGYIKDPLSFFRIHSGQDQNEDKRKAMALNEWFEFIVNSYNNNYYINFKEYSNCLSLWMNHVRNFCLITKNKNNNLENSSEYKELIKNYKSIKNNQFLVNGVK